MERARSGEADSALDGVDVLAMPTIPLVAPAIAEMRADDVTLRIVSFTSVIDFTGQPAISVPCGLGASGMPVGLMFVGRRWDEASVLWAGRAYEQIRGPFPAPPLA
jgi:amidase